MKPKIAAILIALAVLAGGGVGYAVLRMGSRWCWAMPNPELSAWSRSA